MGIIVTRIASTDEYMEGLLHVPRPGLENVLAFYDHRLDMICRDPRMMVIPLDDHLVHRGDGVFETLKFEHSRVYQLDAHLQRMKGSCEALYLQPPCSWKRVRELMLDTCAAGGQEQGLVTVLIGRGPGGFSIDFRECPESSLYLVVRRFKGYDPEFWERGATAFRVKVPAKQDYLSKVKSVDYLPNVLMKREAVLKGYDYPLCFDEHGFLAEGATENVCLVTQTGELVVPELRQALEGRSLMRSLELLAGEVQIVIRPVEEWEIMEAREVILLGTSFDAVGVVRYNDSPIHDVRPGPMSRRMRQLLQQDLLDNGTRIPETG